MTVVPKSSLFGKQLKTFIYDKNSFNNGKIILLEGDNIRMILVRCSKYSVIILTCVANNIVVGGSIPAEYYTKERFSNIEVIGFIHNYFMWGISEFRGRG